MPEIAKLTNEDKRSIAYFIIRKGDVTRWCGWERSQAKIEEEYPELLVALDAIETAETNLILIAKEIGDSGE